MRTSARLEGPLEPREAKGFLGLVIQWPRRDLPGFTTAAIPASTNAIVLEIRKGSALLLRRSFTRPADGSATWAKLPLDAATNLSLQVDAYREAEPVPGTSVVIARGTAAGVNIVPSRSTSVPITLDALFAPAISGLSMNAGQPGDSFTISGANLGTQGGAAPKVFFNGPSASISADVTPASSTSLTVKVPDGARIGRVVVSGDGIESVSNAPFWVLTSLGIDAPKAAWDPGGPGSRMVRYGGTLQFVPAIGWSLRPGEAATTYGVPPAPVWSGSNADAGEISATGLFTASRNSVGTDIRATLSTLQSAKLSVVPVGVDKVTVTPGAVTLNALPESGSPDTGYVTAATLSATVQTTLPFNGGVTWTVSPGGLVDIGPSGALTAVRGAPEGKAEIVARAVDDPLYFATASVQITILGRLRLGVE